MGPAAVCVRTRADRTLYVTDRTPAGDRLQRVGSDGKATTVWTWPNRPEWPVASH